VDRELLIAATDASLEGPTIIVGFSYKPTSPYTQNSCPGSLIPISPDIVKVKIKPELPPIYHSISNT